MTGGIFAIHDNDQLIELTEHGYISEGQLQEYLARYPSLLAGDQIYPAAPRRWALVKREARLPGEIGGTDRWSVDHLFLDQDAVPTIVEVKRSSDTRIRREVVGQMLDYAANGVVYWPVDRLRMMFEATHGDRAGQVLSDLLGEAALDQDWNPEKFWENVKTNLEAGRVRLVFVADRIPPELQRVVEFLNGQMAPAQVLAVEIHQFEGHRLRTLVPRVIGWTAQAQLRKRITSTSGSSWAEERFIKTLAERKGKAMAEIAGAILAWAKERELSLSWGKGGSEGSVFLVLNRAGATCRLIALRTAGTLEVPFGHMKSSPFDRMEARSALRERLNSIEDVKIPPEALNKFPTIPLSLFAEPSRRERLLEVLEWMLDQYQQASEIDQQ